MCYSSQPGVLDMYTHKREHHAACITHWFRNHSAPQTEALWAYALWQFHVPLAKEMCGNISNEKSSCIYHSITCFCTLLKVKVDNQIDKVTFRSPSPGTPAKWAMTNGYWGDGLLPCLPPSWLAPTRHPSWILGADPLKCQQQQLLSVSTIQSCFNTRCSS